MTKLQFFINEFNFEDPNFGSVPVGFPDCDISTLTRHEQGVYRAIRMAWLISDGRKMLYRQIGRYSFTIAVLIFITLFGIRTIKNATPGYVKTINAATSSAALRIRNSETEFSNSLDEIVQSTVSAMIRNNK